MFGADHLTPLSPTFPARPEHWSLRKIQIAQHLSRTTNQSVLLSFCTSRLPFLWNMEPKTTSTLFTLRNVREKQEISEGDTHQTEQRTRGNVGQLLRCRTVCYLCLSQNAALEHTTKNAADSLARTFCSCVRGNNPPYQQVVVACHDCRHTVVMITQRLQSFSLHFC